MKHWNVHKKICFESDHKLAKRQTKSIEEVQSVAINMFRTQERSFLLEALVRGMDIQDCYVYISAQAVPPRVMLLQPGTKEEEDALKLEPIALMKGLRTMTMTDSDSFQEVHCMKGLETIHSDFFHELHSEIS